MADESNKFPSMPAKQWWALRERLRRTIPTKVDATYISTALNMTERSAQNNILPALRSSKLIDESDRPTDRAIKWRDDGHYADVCEEIRQEAYPVGLLDLAPPDEIERAEVARWFANTARVGVAQASKLTSFYMLLCEADPSKASVSTTKGKTNSPKRKANKTAQKPKPEHKVDKPGVLGKEENRRSPSRPAFHINVQVHISADSSPTQIDQIFESMAKHLKDFG